jgi:hypothetical protein
MMRLCIFLAVLAVSGCTYYMKSDRPGESAAKPPPRAPDQLCMSDCLGGGGDRAFCTERCTQ